MLRDWNLSGNSEDENNAIPSRKQQDPPAAEAGSVDVIREWSVSAAPEVTQVAEHELSHDPLASPSESVVSGLSMPVFADAGAVRNPFDDDDTSQMNAFDVADNVEEYHVRGAVPSSEVFDTEFSNVNMDVEACQGMPLNNSSRNGKDMDDRNETVDKSAFKWLNEKLNDVRMNPATKFKAMIAASAFIVVICIFAIAGSSPSDQPVTSAAAPTKGSGIAKTFEVETASSEAKQTDGPTLMPSISNYGTLQLASSKLTSLPTFSPTEIPTFGLPPTDIPTVMETYPPTNPPTESPITPSPTTAPITMAPSMDCSDKKGSYLTYNDKRRDCAWLDNGYNGAKSDRKDMNCLTSELGDKCRYTCRLYNDCIDDLLSRIDAFSNGNDFSIGDSCTDKEGTFMGNNHIPRNCSWIEEDPYTAPMKKNLNCGTPIEPRTELGAMCPGSCAGYNECGKDGAIKVSYEIDDADEDDDGVAFDDKDKADQDGSTDDVIADTDDDNVGNDLLIPTLTPTSAASNDTAGDMTFLLNEENKTCIDKEGEFQTHVGPAHLRKCRWFNRDGDGLSIDDKKDLNCHITEIGMNCLETCGCIDGDYLDDDNALPTFAPTVKSSSDMPTSFSTDESSTIMPTIETCTDADGEFETHVGVNHLRQCRWFNRDGDGLTIADKKRLNCHITEIGMNCLGFCGCIGSSTSSWEVADKPIRYCKDPTGAFKNEDGDLKQCDWLDTENSDDKKKFNCGLTELGNACICRCPQTGHNNPSQNVLIQDVSWDFGSNEWDTSKITPRPSRAPTKSPKKHEGRFDNTGKLLLLEPYADATVAQADKDENYGDSLVLRVAPSDNKMQSLLLFDLSFVSKSFGTTFGKASLRLYATGGSTSGGLTFKQMDGANWKENKITWDSIPGGEGSDELILSFLYNVVPDTWYDIDVTAAVRDALERGRQYLSIRITSDDAEVSFASKERDDVPPKLIVDSETASPTSRPTYSPSASPSMSPAEPTLTPTLNPIVPLDCYDHKGRFKTISGESQSCSWFDVGDGALKKELNCNDGEARMFCQAQCSEYNGCDDMTCEDRAGSYSTHSGWTAECSWLLSGQGALKLEMNCGTEEYPLTELGKRCQATCGDYNGCNAKSQDEPSLPQQLAAYTHTISNGSSSSPGQTQLPTTHQSITTIMPTLSPTVSLDCFDREGTFKAHTGKSEACTWFDSGNDALKKELNCQGNREARLFCQYQCREYNGCEEVILCQDRDGSFATHSGWEADCSWLTSGQDKLNLEQNCGTDKYPITEIGKHCQASCGDYNGCNGGS